jgi:predicted Ser/Thr protein kinase
MSLGIGTNLGPYEILAPVGAGGMGEVYRAHDCKLKRDVAIKVLPEAFAADAERMARFEREAQVLASLNHPNIAQIYGVEDHALVMELVEGQSLKGPLPLEKAVEYAGQILDALDAAHRKGIVHRDLKPANILVTKHGIKLLDFGLARVVTGPADGTLTLAGAVMGTPGYMAPEQWEGKPGDARSDIYAFGCVLYEMMTGKLAAQERSAAEPPAIERVIKRCLEKDPDDRWQSARDLRHTIELPIAGTTPVRSRWRERAAWMVLAVALLGGAVFFTGRNSKTPSAGGLVRLTINPPDKTVFSGAMVGTVPVPQFALSPDGRAIVFGAATPGTTAMLWLRPMEEVAAHALPGTENAEHPFWSPDSRWIAFFTRGKLKKIPSGGGAVQLIAEGFPDSRGGSWGPDDTILCSTGSGSIFLVRSTGGNIRPVTKLDASRQEGSHRFPQFLPDGNHFLFTIRSGLAEQRGIYAGSLDGKTKKLLVATIQVVFMLRQAICFFWTGTRCWDRRLTRSVWNSAATRSRSLSESAMPEPHMELFPPPVPAL